MNHKTSLANLYDTPPEVLIVDDVAENLEVLAGILTSMDVVVEISFAMNGEEALETIARHPPDLILLDVNMDGLNGFQVCERLRADPGSASIPVIFLTARNSQMDLDQAFKVGGSDFIPKPFNQMELLARVRCQLELRRLRALLLEHTD